MASKESIRPVQPKTDRRISINGNLAKPVDLFRDLIQVSPEKGWDFDTGDPEFWKFSSELIVPRGRVLDLGSGFGRTILPFALQGMQATAYETNPTRVKAMRVVARNFDLPISVHNKDIKIANFRRKFYDTVIIGQTFTHFESRKEALEVLDKAIDAVKPGGHIWFRGNGKGYDIGGQTPSLNGSKEHYMNTCDCSGEKRMEPHLFFDPAELVSRIGKRGINIVHMQMGEMVTVPKRPNEEPKKRPNIMYGEDWEPDREYFDETVSAEDLFGESVGRPHRTDDIITIIGQKISVASNTGG